MSGVPVIGCLHRRGDHGGMFGRLSAKFDFASHHTGRVEQVVYQSHEVWTCRSIISLICFAIFASTLGSS